MKKFRAEPGKGIVASSVYCGTIDYVSLDEKLPISEVFDICSDILPEYGLRVRRNQQKFINTNMYYYYWIRVDSTDSRFVKSPDGCLQVPICNRNMLERLIRSAAKNYCELLKSISQDTVNEINEHGAQVWIKSNTLPLSEEDIYLYVPGKRDSIQLRTFLNNLGSDVTTKKKSNWERALQKLESEGEDGIDSLYEQTESGQYIERLCQRVENKLNVWLEPSIQGGVGGIWIYTTDDDTCVASDIDYQEYNDSVIDLAFQSKNATEFKDKYKLYLEQLIQENPPEAD